MCDVNHFLLHAERCRPVDARQERTPSVNNQPSAFLQNNRPLSEIPYEEGERQAFTPAASPDNIWSPLRGGWASFRSSVVSRDGTGWRNLFDKKSKEHVEETCSARQSDIVGKQEKNVRGISVNFPHCVVRSGVTDCRLQEARSTCHDETRVPRLMDHVALDKKILPQSLSVSGPSSRTSGTVDSAHELQQSISTSLGSLTEPGRCNKLHLKPETAASGPSNSAYFLHGVVRRLGTHISRRRRSLPGAPDSAI